MPNLTYHTGPRGVPGYLNYILGTDGVSRGTVIPAMALVNSDGTDASTTGLLVRSVGASSNLTTGQATVGTSATQIIAARAAGRNNVTITQGGTTDVYIGAAGVTTGTGILLSGVKGTSITLPFTGAIFGVVATGSQAVSYAETY